MSRRLISIAVLSGVVVAGTAYADLSRGVISAFTRQIVISKDELPEGKNDKETITKIKSLQLKELVGTSDAEITTWHFHYSAFLAKTGSSTLKLNFYTDDKDHRLSANQRLDGVDPKSSVLLGDISINEDEGLAKGRTYDIKLETDKDVVVAETKLVMK